ncbi:MBL fold metallo-hydrolase [Streptomyces indicus]|uniref:Glyoxylase, beta-lactamase superfamily II n=1 Tax=Streptomyces indicus TaxID=417292 RepID=A0A1G9DD27_9ACTN|nr:MBL fold metallo-hydrolase [Streptomyces indicus]SDK61763.1 Glyoxylase, beta-lactamase superfamily II [Streptomyces indicus]
MDVSWEEFGWEQLGDGIGRRRLPVWDATVALVIGPAGALLFDTGSSLREGAEIRTQVQALLGGRRVPHIALSHAHFDHVLGTGVFAGARIHAAAGMDAALSSSGLEELRLDAVRHGVPEAEASAAADVVIRPHHLLTREGRLDLGGGREVVLSPAGPAHSPHDLVAWIPDAGVLLAGDLIEESGEPQAGPDATPRRWPQALDRLLELGGPDARYVPGHGSVVDAKFVLAQRESLAARYGVS